MKKCNVASGSETRIIDGEISFQLTQFIAINARFVAAVTGDRDRWLLVYADERTGISSHDPEAAGQPRRPLRRGGDFCVWPHHQRLRARRRAQAFEDGGAPDGHACAAFRSATSPPTSRRGRSNSPIRALTLDQSSSRSTHRHGRSAPSSSTLDLRPDEISDSDVSVSREQPREKDGQPVGPQRLTVKRSIQLRTGRGDARSRRLCRPIRAAARGRRSYQAPTSATPSPS